MSESTLPIQHPAWRLPAKPRPVRLPRALRPPKPEPAYQLRSNPSELPLGQFLQARRLERKLSLSDLARRLDCDPSLISRIEHGERSPKLPFLDELARELELSNRERIELISLAGFPVWLEEPVLSPVEHLTRALAQLAPADACDECEAAS
jgi:transcriptional regulator with XRE-family HTH domain